MTVRQELGMLLENKACKKLKLSEANFNKQCAPDLFFLNWKQKSDEFGWLLNEKTMNDSASKSAKIFLSWIFFQSTIIQIHLIKKKKIGQEHIVC